MQKKTIYATLAIIIGLFCSLNSTNAQQKLVEKPRLSILQNYLRVSAAQTDSRSEIFSELSPKEKSDLVKFHLAFQLVKRPALNGEQKELILDSISTVAPESYLEANRASAQQKAKSIEQRVVKLFPQDMAGEIFTNFSGTPEDINFLGKYQSVIAMPSIADRKNEIDKSSPLETSLFYKTQMILSLVIYPLLNREQQNLIVETVSQTRPELYINRNPRESVTKRDFVALLAEKIMRAFPNDVGNMTFALIGDEGPPIDVDPFARCHCLQNSYFFSGCNGGSGNCVGGTCNYDPNKDNGTHCGFLGLDQCDGRCR